MGYPLPEFVNPVAEQPVEFVDEVCGLYFRSILLTNAGMIVPQHVHDHDHATLVGSGCVRLWVNGSYAGDFEAGHAVAVLKGCEHVFLALEPNTRLTCVHDVSSADSLKEKGV